MSKVSDIAVTRAVSNTISRAQARTVGQAAADAFSARAQGERNYADLLASLWAQVDRTMADLDGPTLTTVDRAKVLATVARILPQLQAAEQNWRMSIGERSIASLTGRELRDIVRAIDGRESTG